MADSFKGKVVLVTGAAGGIGLATARAFGDAGASVIVADSNIVLLETAAVGLRSAGHQVLPLGCDVTARVQVKAMIERAVKDLRQARCCFQQCGHKLRWRADGRN